MALDLNAELKRGYEALARGALEDAAAAAEVAVAGAPDQAESWRLLARVQLLRGALREARATLQQGASSAVDALLLHADLAELSIRETDGPRALAAALEARRMGGDQVRWVLLTARARALAGDGEAALADFKLAGLHAPDLLEVQLPYARQLLSLCRTDEAIAVLQRYLARRPGGEAAALLVHAALDESDPAASLPLVDAGLAPTPDEPALRVLKAMLLTLAGDAAAAAPYLDALERAPYMRARWAMFEHLRELGCERFVGLPFRVLELGLDATTVVGHVAEFGVFNGRSLRHIAARYPGTVHGFDSFRGLPEDWTPGVARGAFDRGGVAPSVPANVVLHTGDFAETLPAFAPTAGPARLWHVDCDLYSSTRTVFDALGDTLRVGSVVVFDDYLGYPDAKEHEFRAWAELCKARGIRYTCLAGCLMGREVALRVDAIAGAA
jgi:tetratricopeptide (TPR) repeat protein